MKTSLLPLWLSRVFAVLFYGQLAACFFAICTLSSFYLIKPNPEKKWIEFYLEMPLSGIVLTQKGATLSDELSPDWLLVTDQRELDLGVPATLSHVRRDSGTHWLRLSISSWRELALLPISLLISTTLAKMLNLLLSLYICYLFMHLFQSLTRHHIFDQNQIRRLLLMGQSFLLYTILVGTCKVISQEVAIGYLNRYGYGVVRFSPFEFSSELLIDFVFVLIGLCILALTQVFKYGTQLRQENELTI